MRTLPLAVLLSVVWVPVSAQTAAKAPAAPPAGSSRSTEPMPAVQLPLQPTVHANHTVTFRYAAPNAKAVGVQLEGLRAPMPMTRDAEGFWTLTTGPLPPENYSYHFDVDGTWQLDPRNPALKASYTAVGNGVVVPGTPAEPWETTAVPHGTVHHHTYTTHVVTGLAGDQSEYYVYTPAGYDARGTQKYPVLYLLHGWSDTAAGWTGIGHANDILDNLIAAGKTKPMIVVMPLGYGQMSFVRDGFTVWQDPAKVAANVRGFGQALLGEVMPAVERDYNVSAKREDRAIAGLSMGGLESLALGLKHPELFAQVGGFSSAVLRMTPAMFAQPDAKYPLKTLWVACGTSDDLIAGNREAVRVFKEEGYPVTGVETPGMHTWLVWRDNLVEFSQLLFK